MSALPQTADRPAPVPRVDADGTGRPPPLRLVPTRHGPSRVVLLVVLVLVGVLGVVALQAQAAGAAFAVRDLEAEVTDLQRRHEQLTAEVAALQSPERLREIATSELGMVPASEATYLDLSQPGRLAAAARQPLADPVKQVRSSR